MSWPPEIGELLPRAAEATGVHEKLAAYSLNRLNADGSPKAHGFAVILGITIDHLDHLESEIRAGILTAAIESVRKNAIGRVNCVVALPVRGVGEKSERAVNVRTVWELADADSAPRLVSAFPKP